MNIKQFLFVLFWLVLIIDCYFIANGLYEYRLYSKSLLVPILLFAIYFGSAHSKHFKSKLLINLGLLFCFIGDIFLLSQTGISNFILGLFAFLIALIFFNILFLRLTNFKLNKNGNLLAAIVIVVAYLAVSLWILFPHLRFQYMEIPVSIYAVVMGSFIITGLNTVKIRKLRNTALYYFVPGSIFFAISDSLLALDRFYSSFRYAEISVMLTYGVALFLLSAGFIRFLGNGETVG